MYLRNGKVGIFDLSSLEHSETELPEEGGLETFSAIGVSERLAYEHGLDSIVLGTGVLTGSLAPAACAAVMAGRRTSDGTPRYMPILGFAGVELKLSGFDFIVVKGRAEKPGYLWVRDGIIEFVENAEPRIMDSWARTDRIRANQGDVKIQVLAAGRAGDSLNECGVVVTNYWVGEDKACLGADLGRKNLAAIAFRGMGELEIPDGDAHLRSALEMRKDHSAKLGKSRGLLSYAPASDREDFKALIHRVIACFGCPYPCRTYVKLSEDPAEMRHVGKEPGYLQYDIPTLELAFKLGLSARDATLAIVSCAKAGAEPYSVLSHAAANAQQVTLESVNSILATLSEIAAPGGRVVPGDFESSFPDPASYRACLGLGLCPRYWARAGLDMKAIGAFLESATDGCVRGA